MAIDIWGIGWAIKNGCSGRFLLCEQGRDGLVFKGLVDSVTDSLQHLGLICLIHDGIGR